MDQPGYPCNLSDSLEDSRAGVRRRAGSRYGASVTGICQQFKTGSELLGRRDFPDWREKRIAAPRLRLFRNDWLQSSSYGSVACARLGAAKASIPLRVRPNRTQKPEQY